MLKEDVVAFIVEESQIEYEENIGNWGGGNFGGLGTFIGLLDDEPVIFNSKGFSNSSNILLFIYFKISYIFYIPL